MSGPSNETRVLFLIQGVELGGLEMVVRRIAEGLPRDRYRCAICCFDTLGEMEEPLRAAGIEVFLERRRPGIDWRYPFRLRRRLRDFGADVLHAHNDTALFYGTVGGRLARVPVIYTEHDRQFPGPARTARLNRLLARLDYRVVTVSETLRGNLIRHEQFPPEHVRVIVNGVPDVAGPDPARVDAVRDELALSKDNLVVGTIGRLDPIKNHARLLESFGQLADRFPNAVLVIIGAGTEAERLRALRTQLGLDDRVRLPGERREIAEYLAAFDVFVLPSKSEGMPLALIEALAAGLPSVSTDVGGVREVVEDGQEGFVVPPEDWCAFEEKLASLLDQPAQRATFGHRARVTYKARFTLSAMVDAYRSLYDEAVASNRRRRNREAV